jgi:hypothetical protein
MVWVGQRGGHRLTRDRSIASGPMSTVNRQAPVAATRQPELSRMQRTPQRVSITLSWQLHQRLLDRSDLEGRSLSNLAAHLLELSMC